MPTNTESLNRELFRLLSKYKPKPLDAEGKATPVPEEADVFKFEFTKDGEEYGTVYVTLDDERTLTVYFGDDVSDSPGDKTPRLDYDDTWSGLLHQLSSWRMTKGLRGFKTQNKDRVSDDMARRNHMRNKDKIAEGYYATGKKSSYSDAVPSVKIVIEHSRVIEEGEQRYRNINRIFLENQAGERYLLDTKKPGIARVYARHIAEGGKVNDDRWSHIGNLCEEYQKMAGFVRATRNGQFNESAQSLVNEGIEHYASLRESLSRMTGKRGYNSYFESWTPPLMEDGTEENNLNELFVQETLDPRIESVMPILNRIHKKVSESVVDKEMNKLAEWADSLVEEESLTSNNPGGIPEDRSLKTEAKYDPTVDGSHSYGTDLLFNIRMLYIYARDGRDTRHQIASLKNLKDGIEQSEEPRLIQCYDYLMKNLAGGTVTDPKMIMQIADKAHQLFHPSLEPIAQATREGVEMEEAITPGASLKRFKDDPDMTEGTKTGNPVILKGCDFEDVVNWLVKNVGPVTMKSPNYYNGWQGRGWILHSLQSSNEDGMPNLELSANTKLTNNQVLAKTIQMACSGPQGVAEAETPTHKGGSVTSKNGVTQHKSGSGVYGGYDASRHPDSPEEKHVDSRGAKTGHRTDKVVKHKDMEEAINTGASLQRFRNDPRGNQKLPATPAKEVEESALQAWLGDKKYGEKGMDALRDAGRKHVGKAKMQKIRAQFSNKEDPVSEEVDMGQYDAAKPISNSGTTPEQEKKFRKKVQAYGKELDQRQKEKAEKTDEDLDANQKRVGQLGPTGGPAKVGDLVGANENFINTVDQAVTTEDEMDEGEHTQHAMRGRNPGANEFEHDFEPEDKIGNIHDKISKMLKRLEKPKNEPNMKDTDLGSTVLESEERPYVCVHAKKGKCEVKASSSYQAAQKAAQKWGLKGTAGIDAHLADVKKDTSSLEESTDELARILTIMNHRR